MATKKCFKCERTLELSDFYKHPRAVDGHMGKCKDCTKQDVRDNYQKRKLQYAVYERERFQRPERKQFAIASQRRRRARWPEKNAARQMVSNAIRDGKLMRKPCEVCGTDENVQAHHEDYSKPLDVNWLCFKHHRERHGQKTNDLPWPTRDGETKGNRWDNHPKPES